MIGDNLTVSQAFGVSLTGILVVFMALIALLIAIKIITAIVGSIGGKDSAKSEPVAAKQAAKSSPAPRAKASVQSGIDPETLAAIVGAISMERRSKIDGFKIVSITEIK